MYKVAAEIEGIVPMLMDRLTIQRYNTDVSKLDDQRKEEFAKDGRHYEEGIGLYCPANCLKVCILNGGYKAGIKIGKKGISQTRAILRATLYPEPDKIPFSGKIEEFIHESLVRIPPVTGGMVPRLRAGIKEGWTLSFNLIVADDSIDINKVVRASLEAGGIYEGLLNGRPEFGRFIVKKFSRERLS